MSTGGRDPSMKEQSAIGRVEKRFTRRRGTKPARFNSLVIRQYGGSRNLMRGFPEIGLVPSCWEAGRHHEDRMKRHTVWALRRQNGKFRKAGAGAGTLRVDEHDERWELRIANEL